MGGNFHHKRCFNSDVRRRRIYKLDKYHRRIRDNGREHVDDLEEPFNVKVSTRTVIRDL